MTKRRRTRRALINSIISLLICFSMLLGTTFAWFTDSVTSTNNIIKSGDLDIELYYQNDETSNWTKVDANTNIFKENTLWEPGHTEVVKLKMANEGTLALKYQLGVNVAKEIGSQNVAGENFKLSDYIYYGVTNEACSDRAAYVKAVEADAKQIKVAYTEPGSLKANGEKEITLVAYMPESVGNEANYKAGAPIPVIKLGINLFATQYTAEADSFDDQYDAGAQWTGGINVEWYTEDPDATEFVIDSPEELAALAAIVNGTATSGMTFSMRETPVALHDDFAGDTVKLGRDIDLNDIAWTPIGRIGTSSTDFTYAFKGTFDGGNHTISNLNVSNDGWAGLFGIAHKATIKNVKINGASIMSNRMAGTVAGQLYGSIDNCHVANADIMVVPNAVSGGYDNGDKVGGIVGWIGDNNDNRTLTNCSVTDSAIGAYRDVGGIAGYVAWSTEISDNKVKNTEITVDQVTNFYGEKDPNAGEIWGRNSESSSGVGVTAKNNTAEDINIDKTYVKSGLTLKADNKSEDITLYLVPAEFAEKTVTVPEGVTTIGNYAFAYNSNVETVILASTVRDLGRGFDSSTVKKVVLNEGLTTISSRAFRSTTALEEVVISSTVTEIADNAFQKSSIKGIVIPANVKTVGETAFGASLIETVTFEGDIDIQGYAFRGCPNLKTVNMYGEDVKFVPSTLNGRNSMWFCNGESNNPNTSDITFTVRSEEIKERVLTAMGAERNNTTVIVDDGFVKVESAEELLGALENATEGTKINATGVTLNPTGTMDTTVIIPAGVTLKGAAFTASSQAYLVVDDSGEDVIFEKCEFNGPGFGMFIIAGDDQNGSNMVFENCTFKGQVAPNFVQNSVGTSTFNNCTFALGSDNIGLVNCMGGTHTFNNCTFDYTGGATFGSNQFVRWNAVNSYSESYSTAVTLNGCTFKNCGTQRFGGNSTLTINK